MLRVRWPDKNSRTPFKLRDTASAHSQACGAVDAVCPSLSGKPEFMPPLARSQLKTKAR